MVCLDLLARPTSNRSPNGIVPEAATAWPRVSRNGKTFTFTIRKGLRFHTGERVDARHFAYAISRIFDPRLQVPFPLDVLPLVGADDVLAGRARTASGIRARGDKLTIRLTKPFWDLPARLADGDACPLPLGTPAVPGAIRAPFGGGGPYYVERVVPGEVLILRRNRFYRGPRATDLERIVHETTELDEWTATRRRIERGELDIVRVPPEGRQEVARQYGVNRGRYRVDPQPHLDLLVFNLRRPLFANNLRLRKAVNFAIDRPAIARQAGLHGSTPTAQYVNPAFPGFRDARLYPLSGPNIARARALANGMTRSGKAVIYGRNTFWEAPQAQLIRANLARIGLDVEVHVFPTPVMYEKIQTRGEPWDLAVVGLSCWPDPSCFLQLLADERGPGNFGGFRSATIQRRLERAYRLSGEVRYRAFGSIDVTLARDHAPFASLNHANFTWLFSDRVGCLDRRRFPPVHLCLRR